MSDPLERVTRMLSIDDGAIGSYDGDWAEGPQDAYAMVSADGSRLALVAARREELAEIAPHLLGSAEGSVYEASRDRPSMVVAAAADIGDAALRLSDMSGGLSRGGPSLEWGAVEAVADRAPADRAAVVMDSLFGGGGSDPLVARMGCLLARDRTYGLARMMPRDLAQVLVDGPLPPHPRDAGRNGPGGPAAPFAYADVAGASETHGVRSLVYGRTAPLITDGDAVRRARAYDEGVLSGAIRPWARHALMAASEADREAYASKVFVRSRDLAQAMDVSRRIIAGLEADPLSVVALAIPWEVVSALPETRLSEHDLVAPWIDAIFPESRSDRQFAAIGRTPEGGVAIAMTWARTRDQARVVLSQTPVPADVVHDVSRMLNLPGDAFCFGCSQVASSGAPTAAPSGQRLH